MRINDCYYYYCRAINISYLLQKRKKKEEKKSKPSLFCQSGIRGTAIFFPRRRLFPTIRMLLLLLLC